MYKFLCYFSVVVLTACVAPTRPTEKPRFTDDTPHRVLRDKHRCAKNAPQAVLERVNSYLKEKNSPRQAALFSKEAYIQEARLVDDYVSPSYLKRYGVEKNTAQHNDYGGADEVALCIVPDGLAQYRIVTAISQVPNGWTKIMQYKIIQENQQYYFMPANAPTTTDATSTKLQLHYTGMTQLWWIRTMDVIEEFKLQ